MNRKSFSALFPFSILVIMVSLSLTANAATCSLSIKSIIATNPLTVKFTDTVTMTGNSSWNTLSPHVVFNGQDTDYGPLNAGPQFGPGTFSQDYIIVFNEVGTYDNYCVNNGYRMDRIPYIPWECITNHIEVTVN